MDGNNLNIQNNAQNNIPVYEGDLAPLKNAEPFYFAKGKLSERLNQKFSHLESNKQYGILIWGVGEKIVNHPDFPNTVSTSAPNRVYALFCLWAMAEKNMSVEEVTRFTQGPVLDQNGEVTNQEHLKNMETLRNEFVDFCNKNAMMAPKGGETKAEKESRLKNWAVVFKKSLAKVKEFKVPDIDYLDMEQAKPHLDTFAMLNNLVVNAVQESDRMMDSLGNGITDFAAADGEKEFWEMKHSWYCFQEMIGNLAFKTVSSSDVNNKDIFSRTGHMNSMTFAGEYLTPFKGKPVKELLDDFEKKQPLISTCFAEINNDIQKNVPGNIEPKLAISALLGSNREIYLDTYKKNYAKNLNVASKLLSERLDTNALSFLRTIMEPGLSKVLKEAGDDAASMKALNDRDILVYRTVSSNVKHFVNVAVKSLVNNGNYETVLHNLDEQRSDLFLIDGKKPSELWSEKYNDLTADEKEQMFRLEIAKAIATGSYNVQIRHFEFDINGNMKETAPRDLSMGREKTQRTAEALASYAPVRDDMLSALKDMKASLLKTQKSAAKNFGGREEEGSVEYRNYTKALQNVIDVLEQDAKGADVSPDEIRNRLSALERVAAKYHETHKNPKSDDGILRRDLSIKAKTGLVETFDSIRAGLQSNLLVGLSKSVTARNASYSTLIKHFNDKNIKETYGYGDLKDPSNTESYVKAELAGKLNALNASQDPNKKYTPEEEQARKYLFGYFDILINPDPALPKPEYSVEALRLIEHFDDKVKELAANPVFQKYMTENPEKCVRDFVNVEKRAEELHADYNRQIYNAMKSFGSGSKFVTMLPKNSEVSPEDTLRSVSNQEQPEVAMIQYYKNLGKLVVLDALNKETEVSKQMREEIAMNPKRFDEMILKASQYFKSVHALEGKNINKMSERFMESKFTKDFVKHFSAEEVRARKEREEQYKSELDATEKSLAVLFSEDEDIELSKEDYTRFDEKAHYSDAYYVTEEFSDLGRMLWDIPPVSYKEDRLIKTTSPDGKEVEVTLKDVPVIEKLNINEVLKDGKISPTRHPTQQAIFVFWTIAKKGLGINDAFKICGTKPEYDNEGNLKNKEAYELSQEFRKEFLIFVRQNGTGRADARKEAVEQSVKNWADVYKAGTQAVMNSAFPEGNYRNQEDLVKNMPALHQLIRLCIDVDQEFDSIFGVNNKVNARKIAQKHLGGEKAFNELKNSWWALSGAIDDFNNGYGFMSPDNVAPDRFVDHSLSTLRNGLLNRAISRSVAKEIMNGYNGKTLGEISKEKGVKALYQKAFVANISSVSDEYVNSHPELTNEAVKYLLGKKGTFEQDIKPIIDRAMAEAKEQIYTDQIGKANSFKDNLKFENEAVKKLAAVPDGDLEAMKKFMEENVAVKDSSRKDVILSGADHIAAYISDATSGLFNTDKLTICSILGINASDTIRIDGKSPQEIWGEKYASITDPDLKEEYLRAEILKEMVLGRHTIEMRNFMLQGEELVEAPRQLIRPANEKLTELCDAVHVYEAGREDILRELNTLKSRFAVTQLNPDANFTTGAPKEGNTEEYKELTKYLNNLIQILSDEKENVCDKKTILEQFDNFLEAAQEYEKTHTGLFVGRWGTHAKERVGISKDCQKIAPDLKEKYLRLRNGFDSSLSSTNNTNFRDGSYNRIVASVNSMEEAYPFLEAKEEGYYKQKYFEQEMAREIDLLMNKPVPEGPLPEENYRMAREYLIYKYMQKAQDGLANAEDIRFIREADGRINELAGDKVFQAWAKTNKAGCFTGYEEIEKINSRGDAFATYQESKLFFFQREERLQKDHGSLYAYVAGLSEANATGLNEADLGRRADNNLLGILRSNNAENKEGIYDRLAEVILCQATGDNRAAYIPLIHCYRIGVFEENHEREELLKQYKEGIKEMLKEKYPDLLNLSEQNPKALEEFKQKIENGEFFLNNTDAIIDKVTGVMANGFVHKKNAPEAGRDNAQIEQEVLNEKAPQAAPAAPKEPEIDPAVKKLLDDQKEIERKGESGKYSLESMGKGVYINGNLFEAKVRCAIDYIVAKEVELRGGLKQGESAVSIEKELFPTKNERAKLLGLLDSMEGEEFAKLVSDGKFKEAIRPKQEAIQNNGKAVEEGEKQLNGANHQNGNANQKAEGVKEFKGLKP
ncbi:MAG: hypothetical protein IKI20_01390 [Lachnospiraceae bacterium]|nr:hypothetical protein [Lachnospiraceae bacterium]